MLEPDFLAKYAPRFPFWQQRPGITSALLVFHLATDLGLAKNIDVFRDYERIKNEADAGRRVLVQTEREPEQDASVATKILYHVTLLRRIDDTSFTLWSPFQDGSAADLPAADRKWWDTWMATGIVLTN